MLYRFAGCELDDETLELRRDGSTVAMEPQVFKVLVHLLRARDRVVPKEELLDEIWGDRFVSESALTSRIKAARRAVGDDGTTQAIIRTSHGTGYRFVGDVDVIERAPVPAPGTAATAIGPRGPVSYARSGDMNIAYQISGGGDIDIVLIAGFVSHLALDWAEPRHAHFLDRLGTFGRLIRFDKRGTGLSDRPSGLPDLETRMDDLRVVMDAVGSERAVLVGYSEGGPLAVLYAATFPERVSGLVLYGSYARRTRSDDYPWARTKEERMLYAQQMEHNWAWEADLMVMCPTADEAMSLWWGERCRAAASPGAARALVEMNSLVDVREVLPSILAPTLILHRRGDRDTRIEDARFLAEHIPGSTLVELSGVDHFVAIDPDQILDEVQPFLAALRPAAAPDIALVTIVVTTEMAAGSALDSRFAAIVRSAGGTVAPADGGRCEASFDGPTSAVRAASAVAAAAATTNVDLAVAVHLATLDRAIGRIDQTALAVARAIADAATTAEVWVSQVVHDLLPGSTLHFDEREPQRLPNGRTIDVFAAIA